MAFQKATYLSKFVLFFAFLFSAFSTNYFYTHDLGSSNDDSGMESLMLGRILKSRLNGKFSSGGLNGYYLTDKQLAESGVGVKQDVRDQQKYLMLNNKSLENYRVYHSRHGFLPFIASILETIVPIPSNDLISLLKVTTAAVNSILLSGLCLWFVARFSLASGVAIALGMSLSHFVFLANSYWWLLFSYLLPFAGILLFVKPKSQFIHIAAISFTAALIKFLLSGYEFITPTLFGGLVAIILIHIGHRIELKKFLRIIVPYAAGLVVALAVSFTLLVIQIASVEGGIVDALEIIKHKLIVRSYGDLYLPELYTPVHQTIAWFLKQPAINFDYMWGNTNSMSAPTKGELLVIGYYELIAFSIVLSSFMILVKKLNLPNKSSLLILSISLWVSLISPLSWFILFHGHAYVHRGLDDIVFYMPTLILGFAITGHFVGVLITLQKGKII